MSNELRVSLALLALAAAAGPVQADQAIAPVFSRTTELNPTATAQRLVTALQQNGFSQVEDQVQDSAIAIRFSAPTVAGRLTAADPKMGDIFPLEFQVAAVDQGTAIRFERPLAHRPAPAAQNITSQLEQVLFQTIESAITPGY